MDRMKERRKEKEEERKWDRNGTPGREAVGEERFPHPGKPPSPPQRPVGIRRGALGAIGREYSNWSVAGRTE